MPIRDLEQRRAHDRARKAKRRAAGLCRSCPALSKAYYCRPCAERRAERKRQQRLLARRAAA